MVARRERNESRSYKQVRLYLEDIEEIERAMNQVAGPDAGTFQFSNGTWEAETIAELTTKGEGPFNEFDMNRYSPGALTFNTRGSTTLLYVSDTDHLQLRGAYAKIDSILTAAQRPLMVRLLYTPHMAGVIGGLATTGIIGTISIGTRMTRGEAPPAWVGLVSLAVLALSVLILWHQYRTTIEKNGLVYLVPRSARPNFFQRKRDDLVMVVIGGLFGSLLTLLVQRL